MIIHLLTLSMLLNASNILGLATRGREINQDMELVFKELYIYMEGLFKKKLISKARNSI